MIWCKISDTDINTMDLRKKRPGKKVHRNGEKGHFVTVIPNQY